MNFSKCIGKCRNICKKFRKTRLRASYTIEAALVMPIALMAIVLMIGAGFELHDIVLGNLTANEAAELYGHLPENGDGQTIENYGAERLRSVLSDMEYSLNIEAYREGSRVELSDGTDTREYEDPGSRPEKLMRQLTLLDAVPD